MQLTRRRLMLLGAAGVLGGSGSGVQAADRRDSTSGGRTVTLETAQRVADGLWVGPDAAKADVEAARGHLYVATDTGVDYVADGDGWSKLPTGSPSEPVPGVYTERINDVERVDPQYGYDRLQRVLDEYGDEPSTVVIGPGTIEVDDNVRIPANTWLRGSGMHSTTLRLADGARLDVGGIVRVLGDNVVVSDLEVDGNRDADPDQDRAYGTFSKGTTNLAFHRLAVRNCPGYGFDPHRINGEDTDTPTENVVISDSIAENNGKDGITLAGLQNYTVANCVAVDNDRHGINLTDAVGDYATVVGCHAYGNGACGIAVQRGSGQATVLGGSVHDNATGIRIGSGGGEVDYVAVAGAFVADNAGYGLQVRGSRWISLSGCTFRDNANESGNAAVSIQATDRAAERVTVTGCQFDGSTTYGVDERDGTGPTAVVGCAFGSGYDTPVSLAHADSEDTGNLT